MYKVAEDHPNFKNFTETVKKGLNDNATWTCRACGISKTGVDALNYFDEYPQMHDALMTHNLAIDCTACDKMIKENYKAYQDRNSDHPLHQFVRKFQETREETEYTIVPQTVRVDNATTTEHVEVTLAEDGRATGDWGDANTVRNVFAGVYKCVSDTQVELTVFWIPTYIRKNVIYYEASGEEFVAATGGSPRRVMLPVRRGIVGFQGVELFGPVLSSPTDLNNKITHKQFCSANFLQQNFARPPPAGFRAQMRSESASGEGSWNDDETKHTFYANGQYKWSNSSHMGRDTGGYNECQGYYTVSTDLSFLHVNMVSTDNGADKPEIVRSTTYPIDVTTGMVRPFGDETPDKKTWEGGGFYSFNVEWL